MGWSRRPHSGQADSLDVEAQGPGQVAPLVKNQTCYGVCQGAPMGRGDSRPHLCPLSVQVSPWPPLAVWESPLQKAIGASAPAPGCSGRPTGGHSGGALDPPVLRCRGSA